MDFDGDGRIDLFGSPRDAIGSVANYFKPFDWRPGIHTHYPVGLAMGQTDMDSLQALIELINGPDAPNYVAGTETFYATTRYN